MLADAHQQAALDNEQAIADLGDPATKPYVRRTIIEDYWGAAFHWLASGCERKYGQHRDNHQGLVSFLRTNGESDMADKWRALEDIRNAGWYGHQDTEDRVMQARTLCQEIRAWALS